MRDVYTLPDNLPVPTDDGACDHLRGLGLPDIALPSTSGRTVNLAQTRGSAVCYFYPMIGDPQALPGEDWNLIPGARGCTPQSCAYRDSYDIFKAHDIQVFGISSQSTLEQRAAHERLHLPFELLSDARFELRDALHLPTFQYRGNTYIKRLTIVALEGVIDQVIYPVFPSFSDSATLVQALPDKAPSGDTAAD